MNKTISRILITATTIIICYFFYFLYGIIRYSYIPSWQTYKHYMWIFKDSVKKDIDTNYCYSFIRKRDVCTTFHYRGTYSIILWEFKDLGNSALKDVIISQNGKLDNIKFRSGQILNKDSMLEFIIKNGFSFNSSINVCLDEYSKIERSFKGNDFTGLYGFIHKMILSDEEGRPQIILHFTRGRTPTIAILYKRHLSLYLIMINSNKTFDENIINILNLV